MKYSRGIAIGLVVLIVLGMFSFAPLGLAKKQHGKKKIAIMGAMSSEIEALIPQMTHVKTEEHVGRTFYLGELAGKDVVVVFSGVGKVNAGITAQIMFDHFRVEKLIFTGIAGGIDPTIRVADVIVSERLAQHDYRFINDNDPDESHHTWMGNPKVYTNDGAYKPEWYYPDEELYEATMEALSDVELPLIPEELAECIGVEPYSPNIDSGTIITGDQFIWSEKERAWMYDTFDADATEMEGAAVAQVAESNQVPYVVIRSMSDLAEPNPDCPYVFELFAPYAADISASLVPIILENLD